MARVENAGLALRAEGDVQSATLGHEPYQRLGVMRVEVVHDEGPWSVRIGVDRAGDVGGEVLLA